MALYVPPSAVGGTIELELRPLVHLQSFQVQKKTKNSELSLSLNFIIGVKTNAKPLQFDSIYSF